MSLPRGYTALFTDGVEAFAWVEAAGWADGVLSSGSTLHEWAQTVEGATTFEGRGTVYAVPAQAPGPDRRARWAVRHYQRGGLMSSVLDDRYVASGASRPDQELAAAAEARTRGVPTPAVIAGAMYSSGVFYRADLVTELVPDAVSLADVLFNSEAATDITPRDAAVIASELIVVLEQARIVHADLNAMNILLERATGRPHVIDLDRAAALPLEGPPMDGGMRARLERSVRKLEDAHGVPVSEDVWAALRGVAQ